MKVIKAAKKLTAKVILQGQFNHLALAIKLQITLLKYFRWNKKVPCFF